MIGLLRSVWNAPAASPPPPRRVWRDWALVAVLVPTALLEGALRPDLPWRWVAVIVTLGLIPTLLWRRTRPLQMLALGFGTVTIFSLAIFAPLESYTMAFLLLLAYALFRWGSGRAAVIGVAVVLASSVLSDLLGRTGLGDTIGGLAVVLSTITLGVAVRSRAALRVRELDRARSLEREGLARDLHDTVAHHVSAIAIRAQAGLATAPTQPDAATDALEVIEEEASRTLAEMRAMVRVLRQEDAPDLTPTPRIGDLARLARPAPAEHDGPAVAVRLTGTIDDLPPAAQAAIFRLAQESVTNALRHARHATRVDVSVDADASRVSLRVRDDGEGGQVGPPGYGITGMIERAALLGGTCTAGPDPEPGAGRGWTVSAVLPRAGWST